MTEKPETDVNTDYITLPAETYTHVTARDGEQFKNNSDFKAGALRTTARLCSAGAE